MQSEEIIFVNTQGSKNFNALSSFKKHSVDDLGTIVQNYQQGDSLAAEQLHQKFYPLISKLSHRHSMYSIFGEDAENTVWMLFYDFIYKYDGDDFKHLPGLVRRFLIYRLLRALVKEGKRWDIERCLDDEEDFCTPSYKMDLQDVLNNLALAQEMDLLPVEQAQLLKDVYYKGYTQEQLACSTNCSTRTIRRHQTKTLSTLRDKLLT